MAFTGTVASDGSSFSIRELTGDQRSVILTGRGMPYRPLGFKGKQGLTITWLPGNPIATATVLGPQEDPSDVNGYWKDNFASPPMCSLEIFVVDNGSTDGSCETIAAQFPSVKLIRNDRNLGFAEANNQALRVARGDYLMLLNSDTLTPAGSIDAMLQAMAARPQVGVLGPRLLYPDGRIQMSYGGMPGVFVYFAHLLNLGSLVPDSFWRLLSRTQAMNKPICIPPR